MSSPFTADPLFLPLKKETTESLTALCGAVDKAFPLPARFAAALPRDIAELSRLLTSERPLRNDGYLGEPRFFSAYCRYFLPWNVYRLCKLFSALPGILPAGVLTPPSCNEETVISDLGAGPLSFAAALWASFPALRTRKITLYAVDRNKNALKSGKRLFSAFAGANAPWRIVTQNTRIEDAPAAPLSQVTASIFALNEIAAKIHQADTEKLTAQAKKMAALFARRTADGGTILLAEPGIPRSAQYLVLLKEAFERAGFSVVSPCPPEIDCPARGGRRPAKWCHFVFDTDGAPERLLKLSAQAGLPKDHATLSFLLVTRKKTPAMLEDERLEDESKRMFKVRMFSAMFPLDGGRVGRYGCSAAGLVLARGERRHLDHIEPGTLLTFDEPPLTEKDAKSGAFIMPITGRGMGGDTSRFTYPRRTD